MGFTPLEGLAMGTRSGSVDPGVLLYALRERGLTADQLAHVLEHESGLLGLSGRTADVRELTAAAAAGDERAQLALDVFVRRAAQVIGAASASLQQLDGVVFSGGIGENAAGVRAAICAQLAVIGVPDIGAAAADADMLLSPTSLGRCGAARGSARRDCHGACRGAALGMRSEERAG